MFDSLPKSALDFMNWDWSQIAPYYSDLVSRPLTASSVNPWLSDWTKLSNLLYEWGSRLSVATTLNTADAEAKRRYFDYLDHIVPPQRVEEQKLKQKLLESKLRPAGFEIALRNMQSEAELFREVNLPLLTEESKLSTEYDEIIGAQTVEWEGKELTLTQARLVLQNAGRDVRERVWRLGAARQLADRGKINELWGRFLQLRRQIAANAGYANYRDYRWKQLFRFDYTPEDAKKFHQAIEDVVVPAATRVYERLGQHLGAATVRPWDLGRDYVYPISHPPLHPFQTIDELQDKASTIFHRVDPQLGAYFETMRSENLLDLDNRKNKAPGAYCTAYPVAKRPFVFENAVGLQDDVETILHETGHAFHVFETNHLPYFQQTDITMEIAEVASMSMELLGSPYLRASEGGFYSDKDDARARIEHLEKLLIFWPFMAVVDSFQHWVYENLDAAMSPANCDAQWAELWQRFIPGVDWSGLDEEMKTGWHRKLHIHQAPFYYVEYGIAQLGAVQVWRNALHDQADAVKRYRFALSLGATKPLPDLYAAAGVRFALDADILQMAVDLIESKIAELSAVA